MVVDIKIFAEEEEDFDRRVLFFALSVLSVQMGEKLS